MEHTRPCLEISNFSSIAKVVSLLVLFCTIISLPFIGSKLGLLGFGISIFLFAALLMPVRYSIMFFFFYLFLDGALKVLSNYHPVIHIGQDLFLLSLLLRVALQTDLTEWKRTPFVLLFVFFISTVILQYFNPFGLGFLPSVAGTKVYLSSIILFFLVYHNIRSPHVLAFAIFIVILGTVQGLIACVEYLYFPEKIFALSAKYRALAGDRFIGNLYRPFGTTSAPGAPSMWMYLSAPFAYIVFSQSRSLVAKLLCIAFFFISIPTLIFCQTRSAMLLFAVMLVISLLAPTGSWLPKSLLALFLALAFTLFSSPLSMGEKLNRVLPVLGVDVTKTETLNIRFLTLFQSSTYATSRQGASAKMLELAQITPWGIGLSRVGAAAAVWKDRVWSDRYFGAEWSFADSVYRAVFTELGILGLLSWLVLTLTISFALLKRSFISVVRHRRALLWTFGMVPLVILVAGLGSEGILYMPVGAFFWTSLALGLREASHV